MAQTPSPPNSKILLRQAQLSDSSQLGTVAYRAYLNDPLNTLLNPHRVKYAETCARSYGQRALIRMLSPRFVSYVAYPASNPGKLVGYIQFQRLGDNFQKPSFLLALWLAMLAWVFKYWFHIVNWWKPDLSLSKENWPKLKTWIEIDRMRYWDEKTFPERKERWHVQSCVVDPDWQRRGIGRRFMGEVLKRAQAEGVVVGVEASIVGAGLYENVGCEKLGELCDVKIGGGGGGVYMWRSKGAQ
jgi:GNAT superfamily N-acetyltransferase